ncbi:hypothetical protein D3OALGA1CA_2326 [Olavius algarvensis associated proteobacterium Delta 3]|nr:hypothetical protein D3OALGB2SA_227 [Olavius algarvensis associated proteobacterium Delta 3]CAB5116968.1 hypothetical protein D3OALGA1CA_2326 [Olavius algarvensis associated proteobacterium Delta 3]
MTFRQKWWWATLVILCGLLAGCGFYRELRDATRDLKVIERRPDRHLKKKIAMAVFTDLTPFEKAGFKATYRKVLRDLLQEKCAGNTLFEYRTADSPLPLTKLPRNKAGLVDNLAVAETGRRLGANVLLIGAVFDISGKEEKRGIWWFRGSRSYIQIQLLVEAYEMETGAKILDESVSGEIRADPYDVEQLEQVQFTPTPELKEKLVDLARRLGKKVCKEVSKLPWRAFVISVGEEIRISAGKEAGVKQGARFDVYENTRVMESRIGQQFFVPGAHVGRIEIIRVDSNSATGKLISGEPPSVGNSLRVASKKKK